MDARMPTLQGQWSFFHFFGMCHLFLAGILTDVGPPYALELLFRVITPPSSTRTATCQTISEKNQMDIIPQVKIGEVALYIFPACSVQLGSLTPHSDRPPPPGILAHPGFVLYPKLQREGILGAIQNKWMTLINSIYSHRLICACHFTHKRIGNTWEKIFLVRWSSLWIESGVTKSPAGLSTHAQAPLREDWLRGHRPAIYLSSAISGK